MNLTDAQKLEVARWLEQGLKLSDIQKQLETQFGLRPTYMEVKLLVSDLKVLPKDPVETKTATPTPAGEIPAPKDIPAPEELPEDLPTLGTSKGPGKVNLTVDQIARAGAIVSGSVTFSDGQSAAWYLDQMGRLGLAPKQQGYRPPSQDVQEFQMLLERELSKLGY